MMSNELCRLCLSEDSLIYVFDNRLRKSRSMKDIISITTGVEICEKDQVSKNICSKCCQITIKMFKFRTTALKNDKDLKAHISEHNNKKLEFNIKRKLAFQELHLDIDKALAGTCFEKTESPVKVDNNNLNRRNVNYARPQMHPSVKTILRENLKLKLSPRLLNTHMDPIVHLEPVDVESYFQKLRRKKSIEETVNEKVTPSKDTSKLSDSETSIVNDSVISYNHVNNSVEQEVQLQQNAICVNDKENRLMGSNMEKCSSNELEPVHAKRIKLSDNSSMSDTLLALGLTPVLENVSNKQQTESQLFYVDQIKTYMCEICQYVLYKSNDLKRHMRKHMRCQFCRNHFKSLAHKNAHIDSCIYRKAMNSSYIYLEKIENNEFIRQKYAKAFKACTFFGANNTFNSNSSNISLDKDKVEINNDKCKDSNNGNIVSLLSDDEDSIPENVEANCKLNDISGVVSSTNESLSKTMHKNNAHSGKTLSLLPASGDNMVETNILMETLGGAKSNPENIALSTNRKGQPINIKPVITIRNSNIMEGIVDKSSDIKVMKELISKQTSNKAPCNNGVQTDIPTCVDLYINKTDKTCEIRALKQQLRFYKIPVDINFGKYKVAFDYEVKKNSNKRKKFWTQKPIDIEKNLIFVPSSTQNTSIPNVSQLKVVYNPLITTSNQIYLGTNTTLQNVRTNYETILVNNNGQLSNQISCDTAKPTTQVNLINSQQPVLSQTGFVNFTHSGLANIPQANPVQTYSHVLQTSHNQVPQIQSNIPNVTLSNPVQQSEESENDLGPVIRVRNFSELTY